MQGSLSQDRISRMHVSDHAESDSTLLTSSAHVLRTSAGPGLDRFQLDVGNPPTVFAQQEAMNLAVQGA